MNSRTRYVTLPFRGGAKLKRRGLNSCPRRPVPLADLPETQEAGRANDLARFRIFRRRLTPPKRAKLIEARFHVFTVPAIPASWAAVFEAARRKILRRN
jgi:hypothetical protein